MNRRNEDDSSYDGEQRRRSKDAHKLRDMKELFLVEATKCNVFPLDNSLTARAVTPRPNEQ